MNRAMKKMMIVMIAALVMASFISPKGSRTIHGYVIDEQGAGLPGVNVLVKGASDGTVTNVKGYYEIKVGNDQAILLFSYIGFQTEEVQVGTKTRIDVTLVADVKQLEEIVVAGHDSNKIRQITGAVKSVFRSKKEMAEYKVYDMAYAPALADQVVVHNTEDYATIHENQFHRPQHQPLSTFSIDVDAASYSNVRRYISNGSKPPIDAVRIEEMVNYFHYDYPQPTGEAPFSITTEMSDCPWQEGHYLLHVGLQGKRIPKQDIPASNLVFLIDVSGSMSDYNKLPLLKSSFKMLVDELRPEDRVAIVVYAGAAGLVLESTKGSDKKTIVKALDQLNAGGSTAGGAGIQLAYKTALDHYIEGGNNRVILATDGDFNVGQSSNGSLERMIEEKRNDGVFLTVLGFGMGNYKDDKLEILADKGNGNYAYIDDIAEAEKVFVHEFGGTMFTIAKDVKIQVEFNPEKVAGYRLIGYENRKLEAEDFNNDKKDAGELGAGHTVTALYQIIPKDGPIEGFLKDVDELKYQKIKTDKGNANTAEWLTVKLRYKKPDGDKSQLLTRTVQGKALNPDSTSDNFRFSAAVASYGMWLRKSDFKGTSDMDLSIQLASNAIGDDPYGYRGDFIRMVRSSRFMASR
jgi:Ca-activated chloride channel family protein